MALYIDANITGTGGAGTEGDPYKSWSDFRTANNARDLVTEASGEVVVYIKGLLVDPNNAGYQYTLTLTTNATHYMHFQAWPGEESSVFSSMPGFYGTQGGSGGTMFSPPNYTRFTALRVHIDGAGTNTALGLGSNQQVNRCWVKSRGAPAVYSTGVKLRNSIFETNTSNGLRASAGSASGIEIDFCTVIANGSAVTGIDPRSGSAIVRNCVVYVASGGSWTNEYVTNPSSSSGNNAGQLAAGSQPTNIQSNYVQISSDPFVDSAGGDWQAATSGALDGAGVAVSGLTVDLAGVTRGTPPDIGALEAAAGGGGTTKANLIKQVSRYHLGVGSLGRIQRRS